MSVYTDARSRPGQKGAAGTDDRELFLRVFGDYIIDAYNTKIDDYNSLRWEKSVGAGRSDLFPVIGRTYNAVEHEPGERILGGTVEHNEVEVTLDKMMIDSKFIAEIDELMIHYELSQPYAHMIGQSLGNLEARRIAIMHILASRQTTNVPQGQPTPTYFFDANMKTDATVIENACFGAKQYLMENDISGEDPQVRLPWAQYLLCARTLGMVGSNSRPEVGSGNRVDASLGNVAGLSTKATNFIPSTNITTGNTKYQGNFTTTVGHISSKMAVATLNRRGLVVKMVKQDDRLGTLLIGSMFKGHGVLRPECSIELATASR